MSVGRPSRADVVESAVASWTRRMVSLDGSNRMLYFRELSRGTLELSPSRPETRGGRVERLP